MRHISLDESFWRSATEALVSGDSVEDVEPPLLGASRLLLQLSELANRPGGARLGFLTLATTEEERALGLTLAALLARRGSRVLLADCDFDDHTWTRLLGAEDLDGVVDHVGYGTSPARLVRRTSWDGLALLPSGTAPALDPAGILRSDKLRACLDAAGRGHDLVCVGLPFDDALDWGRGATAGMDSAILLGPAGDELAFELAIPRLVRNVELLATLDVPPLGRWRPALGAALPALAGFGERPAEREIAGRSGTIPAAMARHGQSSFEELVSTLGGGSGQAAASSAAGDLLSAMAFPHTVVSEARRASPAGEPHRAVERQPAPPSGAATASDPESQADVAFLASISRADDATVAPGPATLPTAPAASAELPATATTAPAPPAPPPLTPAPPIATPTPPLVHPRLRAVALQQQLDLSPTGSATPADTDFREVAADWNQDVPRQPAGPDEGAELEPEVGRGIWPLALAIALCLVIGAGGFWYWSANQQIPEGQFTFLESSGSGVGDGAASPDGETSGDAGAATGQTAARAPEAVAPAAGTAHSPPSDETETTGQAADASSAPPSAGESSADQGSVPAAVAESPAAPEEPAGDGAGARPEGGETAPGAAAAPPASYAPPTSGPLLAYSLHVGSYQSFEGAQRAASALRAKGLVAYVAPVLLEGKGEWYRVFAGLHPDAPASQESLAGALKSGAVSEGAVRETPWALYLGTFASPELAAELIARLAKSGVSGYAVGTGPVLVYAGAFESAGDAEILNRQLRDRGFEAALVRRRGVEAR